MTRKIRKVDEIKGMINNTLDDKELHELYTWVIARIKANRALIAHDMKRLLKVGMVVEWSGKRGYHKGEVIKVNRTRAVVKELDMFGGRWNVPMNMLKIVK